MSIVLEVQLRKFQKRGPPKLGRMIDHQVLDVDDWREQVHFELADFGLDSGLRANPLFEQRLANRILEQDQSDRQNDQEDEEPKRPAKNELHTLSINRIPIAESPFRSHIAADVEIHDIARALDIVRPLEIERHRAVPG